MTNLPHALIITGGTEASRRAEAVQLAAGLLCEKPNGIPCQTALINSQLSTLNSQPPCPSCKKVLTGGHPDVTFLEPEKSQIVVDQVRALRAALRLSPNEGSCKIAVIMADALNVHAQNALLNVLEEPPANAYFFLLSEHPSLLLPTVRSRCAVKRISDVGDGILDVPPFSSEAQTLLDALLANDEWAWTCACLSMEKRPRDRLSETLDELAALLLKTLPGQDVLTARRFGGIIDQIRVLQDMLTANVGAGHVCGMLAACGAL